MKRLTDKDRKRKPDPLGFVLYEGPSLIGDGSDIVVIATLHSRNTKTGDMVQVWILPAGVNPVESLKTTDTGNTAICGDCVFQGYWDQKLRKRVNAVCYVNVGQAPQRVWRTYRKKSYLVYKPGIHSRFLRNRKIRIGAYGDPAAMPTDLIRYLAMIGKGWSGYSHQLLGMADQNRANDIAQYLMCSCDNKAQHNEALRRGWRTFTVLNEQQATIGLLGSVQCPNYTHGVTCEDCLLCCGTSKTAKSVFAIAHSKKGFNLGKVNA